MSQSDQDRRIDYIELSTADLPASKRFFSAVCGWTFKDYGDAYASFDSAGVRGGLAATDAAPAAGALVVLYAVDLSATREAIVAAGGVVVQDTFDFPGGRRFHFREPGGNVLGVWSER